MSAGGCCTAAFEEREEPLDRRHYSGTPGCTQNDRRASVSQEALAACFKVSSGSKRVPCNGCGTKANGASGPRRPPDPAVS